MIGWVLSAVYKAERTHMKISEILEALQDRDPEQRVFVLFGGGQAYPISELRTTDVQLVGETDPTQIVLAVTNAPPPAVESLQQEISALREIVGQLRGSQLSAEAVMDSAAVMDASEPEENIAALKAVHNMVLRERDELRNMVTQINDVLAPYRDSE
jgi:hypothetical protein